MPLIKRTLSAAEPPAAAEGTGEAGAEGEAAAEPAPVAEEGMEGEEGEGGPPKPDYSKNMLEYVAASPGQVCLLAHTILASCMAGLCGITDSAKPQHHNC